MYGGFMGILLEPRLSKTVWQPLNLVLLFAAEACADQLSWAKQHVMSVLCTSLLCYCVCLVVGFKATCYKWSMCISVISVQSGSRSSDSLPTICGQFPKVLCGKKSAQPLRDPCISISLSLSLSLSLSIYIYIYRACRSGNKRWFWDLRPSIWCVCMCVCV